MLKEALIAVLSLLPCGTDWTTALRTLAGKPVRTVSAVFVATPEASDDGSQTLSGSSYYSFQLEAFWEDVKIEGLPKGWYRMRTSSSDKWSYTSGGSWNAYGNTQKDNTGGAVQPGAYFGQLIVYGKTSSSSSAKKWWIPYAYDKSFYYSGGTFKMLCNDRPGQFGDNKGDMTVKLYPK